MSMLRPAVFYFINITKMCGGFFNWSVPVYVIFISFATVISTTAEITIGEYDVMYFIICLTPKVLKYLCISCGNKSVFFQIEITINVLVSSFRFT